MFGNGTADLYFEASSAVEFCGILLDSASLPLLSQRTSPYSTSWMGLRSIQCERFRGTFKYYGK